MKINFGIVVALQLLITFIGTWIYFSREDNCKYESNPVIFIKENQSNHSNELIISQSLNSSSPSSSIDNNNNNSNNNDNGENTNTTYSFSSSTKETLPIGTSNELKEKSKRKLALLTVICKWDSYHERALVRQTYGDTLRKLEDKISLVFSVGKPEAKWNETIEVENKFHNDIIVLDEAENMNQGKTLYTFQALQKRMPYAYDFVVKLDTDSFLWIVPFVRFLEGVNKTSTYGGPMGEMFWEKVITPKPLWAPGGFYFLSWDLIDFIAHSPYAYENKNGPEDVQTAWMVRNASCQHFVYAWHYQHGMKDPKSWWIEVGKALRDGKLV